jgi:tetratricopeptide (TPR) repeat protein
MKPGFWFLLVAFLSINARACIWDADSLEHEKTRSHDLTTAILGEPPAPEDPQKLQIRIAELQAHRDETNADWWNNLAGAYLRLNQPSEAVKLLEPVVTNFSDNYGIHANLGTAYHLLGRYADAEKEIARDLEINPEAHFGLEKYHLALLQYLMRDTNYQSRHVYVDELTATLLSAHGYLFNDADFYEDENFAQTIFYTNGIAEAESDYENLKRSTGNSITNIPIDTAHTIIEKLGVVAVMDPKPAYRTNWNLGTNENFQAGVIYMAQMNPKEPACFEMLGIAAWRAKDYHLAVSAFQKAIELGSNKADILRVQIADLNHFIRNSLDTSSPSFHVPEAIFFFCLFTLPVLFACYIFKKIRDRFRNRAPKI